MIWVRFMDMHSGGGMKQAPYDRLYLRAASEKAAIEQFMERFGHDPEMASCDTCGRNYSIDSDEDLHQLSGYDRNLRFAHPKGGSKNWGSGRYLEPDEVIPKGWEVSAAHSPSRNGIPLHVYLRKEDVYFDAKSDLEYLADLEIPPHEKESP
jgi:hypothetical protein